MGQRSVRKKKHSFNRKPRKKLKKNEKQKPKHSGIVRRLVELILRDEDKSQPIRPNDLIHHIFKKCFVIPSAQRGLFGDTDNLAVSGDGMVLNTGASHKWRCPHVCLKSVNCPFFNRPEGDYGRTYYTKFKDDIRIFTQTVRGSKNWKDTLMKKRTSSERRNDRKMTEFVLNQDG